MALSVGHTPWKNDTFLRNPQQTQAYIIDELGESHLGLLTNPRFKSVLLEGMPVFLIMASLWNNVNFPRDKGFSYGTSMQLRRPVLSPRSCFRHCGWSWTRHDEKDSYACWAGVPFLKAPIQMWCQNPRKAIQWADWHGMAFPSPPLRPPRCLPCSGTSSPVVRPGQGSEPAGKEGDRFVVTELK